MPDVKKEKIEKKLIEKKIDLLLLKGNYIMRNILLSDCDGVLLNWEDSFEEWMFFKHKINRISFTEFDHYGFSIANSFGISQEDARTFIDEFNASDHMLNLPPIRDSVKYVRKLYEEHGIVLHVITTFGTSILGREFRRQNLENVFNGAVKRVVCLNHSDSKEEALKPYSHRGLSFVEDRKSNVDLAMGLNIQGILMQHDYNLDYEGQGIRVKTWQDIYEYLTENIIPDTQVRYEHMRLINADEYNSKFGDN